MPLNFDEFSNENFDNKTSIHTGIIPNYKQFVIQCCSNDEFSLPRWNVFIDRLNDHLSTQKNIDEFRLGAIDFDMDDKTVYRAVHQNYNIIKTERCQMLGELATGHLITKKPGFCHTSVAFTGYMYTVRNKERIFRLS